MSLKPFVFLPGFLCDERLWQHQVKSLSEVAPTKVVDLRHCRSLEDMLAAVNNAAFPNFHLVGFSMGGYIAQVFAAKYPEKVAALTLVATSGGKLSDLEIKARTRMESVLKATQYKGISHKELQRYVHPESLAKPEIADVIMSMCAENTSEMYLGQMRATLHRLDQRVELAKAKFPIQIIASRDDQVIAPSEIQNFHESIPQSELFIVEGCGHYIPLEKPEELTALIKDFV